MQGEQGAQAVSRGRAAQQRVKNCPKEFAVARVTGGAGPQRGGAGDPQAVGVEGVPQIAGRPVPAYDRRHSTNREEEEQRGI